MTILALIAAVVLAGSAVKAKRVGGLLMLNSFVNDRALIIVCSSEMIFR